MVKGKHIVALIALIIIIDQIIKIYIKTHFYLGQEIKVLGMEWMRIHFVENEGMAWGLKFGGSIGKIALSLFRLVAVIVGAFYLANIIKSNKYHKGFIICGALIFAGALGNLIDSMFYGLIFENSGDFFTQHVAKIFPPNGGYAGFLHGRVVDMFYFPIIRNAHFPSWVPFWGGEDFEFFRPVFNLADASISVGVITLLLFQKRFFKHEEEKSTTTETETVSTPTSSATE